jgi:hypothetical protein
MFVKNNLVQHRSACCCTSLSQPPRLRCESRVRGKQCYVNRNLVQHSRAVHVTSQPPRLPRAKSRG